MRIINVILALTFSVVAATTIRSVSQARYECNIVKKRSADRLLFARGRSEWVRGRTGRSVAAELNRCPSIDPSDHEVLFLIGEAETIAGRPARALRAYHRALQLNERPDTYAKIAALQFELQQADLAYQNLLRASLFNLTFAWSTAPHLIDQIHRDFEARKRRIEEDRSRRTPP